MKTYSNKDAAYDAMKMHNKCVVSSRYFFVVVDGPNDGEYSVMTMKEAIENEFMYSVCW